jgi:thioredoxin 1
MAAKQSSKIKFQQSIATGVTLVDFNAPWCKPCRVQERIINMLQKNYHGTAKVMTLNIDRNQDLAFSVGIQSVPTLIIYKDGREMNRFIGLQTTETLSQATGRGDRSTHHPTALEKTSTPRRRNQAWENASTIRIVRPRTSA